MRPNPPAEARAQWLLLLAIGGLMAFGAIRFLLLGAWVVLPFMALDIGLLWWALRASRRLATIEERVRLCNDALEVRRLPPVGLAAAARLHPAHVRLEVERRGAADFALWIASPDRRVRIGEYLTTAERAAVRAELEAGLERWRRARR